MWPQPITYTGSGRSVTEDSFGDIWMVLSGVAGGVVQIPNGNINNPSAWTIWENINSGVSLQFLNRIAADQSGNVWVGYDGACSVSKYNHANNSWTNYNLYQLGQITCGAGSGITSIRVDDSNNVWVCGLAGLAKFDQANWTFYSYLNTPMQQGFVNDISFDNAGNKWVATEHGLFKFDGISWTEYNTSNSGILTNYISSVLVDDNNLVWTGCYEDVVPNIAGLNSFDGTTWNSYTTSNSGLPEKFVRRMALDTLGNIWIITEGHGAAIFNPNGVLGFDCIDKSLQSCTVTGEIDLQENQYTLAEVYPNPVSSIATLELNIVTEGNVQLSLKDITGREQILSSVKNLTSGLNKIDLDLSNYASGIYFLRISHNNKTEVLKIIKN